MRAEPKDHQTDGYEMLKGLLTGLRSKAEQRIKTLRKEQEEDLLSGPADAMDSANSTEEVEIHAGLIAREEEKLIGLDEALARVNAGQYGKCLKCHEAIPFERLMAVPFASYCVDCQSELNRARPGWGDGGTIEPYDHQWTVPEEMKEAAERDYQSTAPEENLPVRTELLGGTAGPVAQPKARASAGKAKSRHKR
jgi:DnaK suppressor protein